MASEDLDRYRRLHRFVPPREEDDPCFRFKICSFHSIDEVYFLYSMQRRRIRVASSSINVFQQAHIYKKWYCHEFQEFMIVFSVALW